MRKIQKIIIVIYVLLVVIACIYVPWAYKQPYKTYEFVGYSFIWQPPIYLKSIYANTVEFLKIIFELIALTALFGGLYALTLKPKKE